ncbi:MAG: GlsB/YeaQ/YmgE family stress response membrane protein [Pseudomonadota bacterium]
MSTRAVITFLVVGLIAGWLASLVVGGGGIITYLVSGVIGAFVGPFVFKILKWELKIGGPLVTQTLVSAVGAMVVVIIARIVFFIF